MNHEIEVGPMFAGKTTALINKIKNCGELKIVVKPKKDDRYDCDSIVSHKKESYPALNAEKLMDLVPHIEKLRIQHVFIDEGHFFADLVEFVNHHYIQSIRVVIAGLDFDYLMKPFESMTGAADAAQTVTKHKANCMRCKKYAEYTARYDADDNQRIRVGGSGTYYPCCAKCHPCTQTSE